MRPLFFLSACLTCLAVSRISVADEFEREPINYSRATPVNAISKLQTQIDSHDLKLEYDPEHGYLRSLLKALKLSEKSQTLVFSKTSLQRSRITPRTPRALYFNDDVYLGYCRNGDVLEISVADPKLGTVFYTIDQDDTVPQKFLRQTDSCLICHSSSRTQGIPGHLVRSVYADASGLPIFSSGSYTVEHTTPFEKRWGGWYVSGTHGDQEHLGNLIIRSRKVPQPLDNSAGQNRTDLDDLLPVAHYPSSHSDLIALSVLAHQTHVHNLITRANFATRQALHYQDELNRELGEPPGHRWESTKRRIASAGEDLVEGLLFVGEMKLSDPIRGVSGFAEEFEKQGPFTKNGRSLREFDLQTRLFNYPCSYLVYSPSFDALPKEALDHVGKRLAEILSGKQTSEKYQHLSEADRVAIREILIETKPNLASYFKK